MKTIISAIFGILTFIGGFFLANFLIGLITSGLIGQTLIIVKLVLWVFLFGTITAISFWIGLMVFGLVEYILHKLFPSS